MEKTIYLCNMCDKECEGDPESGHGDGWITFKHQDLGITINGDHPINFLTYRNDEGIDHFCSKKCFLKGMENIINANTPKPTPKEEEDKDE